MKLKQNKEWFVHNIIGFILLTISINVLANDVYKCTVDGVTAYSQYPCGNDSEKINVRVVDSHDKKYPSVKRADDIGSPLLFRPIFAKMDEGFKNYFTDNFKNSSHTSPWAKYVIGFEYDEFTRYIIVNDSAPTKDLLLLCSQIRSYNMNNLNDKGKVLSGEVRLVSNRNAIAKYSPLFDSCSTIDGKSSKY